MRTRGGYGGHVGGVRREEVRGQQACRDQNELKKCGYYHILLPAAKPQAA